MTDKQFRFARTSQCYCLGQRENACSKANCTGGISLADAMFRTFKKEGVLAAANVLNPAASFVQSFGEWNWLPGAPCSL